jgi:hypothetical protein
VVAAEGGAGIGTAEIDGCCGGWKGGARGWRGGWTDGVFTTGIEKARHMYMQMNMPGSMTSSQSSGSKTAPWVTRSSGMGEGMRLGAHLRAAGGEAAVGAVEDDEGSPPSWACWPPGTAVA